jgi:hypothetical protein
MPAMPAASRVPDVPAAHPTAAVGALELEAPTKREPPREVTAALPKSVPNLAVAPAAPAPAPAPAPPPTPAPAKLDGVMMSGSISSQRRAPPPSMYQPPAEAPPQDQAMKLLVAIGVVGLLPIITTAVLTSVAYAPEGWDVVAFLVKPSQPLSLIMQGGLALVALGSAGATIRGAFKRWRGDLAGGPGAAILYACLAGGMLFAAIQFGRAAW